MNKASGAHCPSFNGFETATCVDDDDDDDDDDIFKSQNSLLFQK